MKSAGEEGVTWEAKADDKRGRLHPDSLRKAACGFANRDGGYIIVGAKRDAETREWSLPGIASPDEQPELWIGRVLRGLRPAPRFVPRAWKLGDRIAAVVWIEPVDEPPCMTPQGQVYERVSGETLPVTDPARLDALYRGGQQARGRAEHFANRAARRALDAPEWISERAVGIAVALAPVGRKTDDIASRLFVESFRDAMGEALTRFFRTADSLRGPYDPDDGGRVQQQDALSMFAHFLQGGTFEPGGARGRRPYSTWYLQATWDGVVAAGAALSPEAVEELTEHGEIVKPAWEVVVALVERLGGYGSAHLAVRVFAAPDLPRSMPLVRNGVAMDRPPPPPKGTLFARMPEHTLIGRWTTVADPDPALLASVCRELRRAAGREAWEAEQAPPI